MKSSNKKSNLSFEEQVYRLVATLPRGKVATYASIARALGRPHAARAVGNAMAKNTHFHTVKCFKVIKSTGELGGYSRKGYTKEHFLRKEGIEVKGGRVRNLERYLYAFSKNS